MSINLNKGAKVDLTKTNQGVKKFTVGLGWNPNTSVGDSFDVDVSAFVLAAAGKRVSDSHFVYYNNLKSPNDFLTHTGDNLTGQGEGDDETLLIDFSKATPEEKAIVFVVTIHEGATKNQNFGQISGAYIRIMNTDTGEEIMRYDLNEDFSVETAVVFGKLYEKDGEWKFSAEGIGKKGGLQDYLNEF